MVRAPLGDAVNVLLTDEGFQVLVQVVRQVLVLAHPAADVDALEVSELAHCFFILSLYSLGVQFSLFLNAVKKLRRF